MKKLFLLMAMLLVLTGCSLFSKDVKNEQLEEYFGFYEDILNYENFKNESNDFEYELIVNKISDEQYRYDLVIDEPKVAMYNIKALAVIDDIDQGVNREEMMPSVGIIDETEYNMIPHQIDAEKNYVEGLILSLLSEKNELKLDFVFSYKNSNKNTVKEFYTIHNVYKQPEE